MKTLIIALSLFVSVITASADYTTFAIGQINSDGLVVIGTELFYVELSEENIYINGEDLIVSITYSWNEQLRCSVIVGMSIIGILP